MLIQDARDADWASIYPIFSAVVADGRTYAYPEGLSSAEAKQLWMPGPPTRTVVAIDEDDVLQWAPEQNYRGVQFNAVVESNAAAVRLWTSLGFEIIGTVPGAFAHIDDGCVGLHVMFRPLP